MRTILPFTLLLLVLTAQSITAQIIPISKRLTMEKQIDSVFASQVKAAELIDYDQIAKDVDDRHQAGFIVNGKYYAEFSTLLEEMKARVRPGSTQRLTIQNKKITILSESIALLTATGESRFDTSNGEKTVFFFWSFVYEKMDGQWKVVQSHQSVNQ